MRIAINSFPHARSSIGGQAARGLIESDGCRTVNRFKTKLPSGRIAEYAYPRYFFSDTSADIRGLLDTFIGPKA